MVIRLFVCYWHDFPAVGQGLLIHEVSRSHSTTHQSVGLVWTSDDLVAETSTYQHTQNSQQTDVHVPGGIRTHNLSRQLAANLRLRPRDHWERQDNGQKGKVIPLQVRCGPEDG